MTADLPLSVVLSLIFLINLFPLRSTNISLMLLQRAPALYNDVIGKKLTFKSHTILLCITVGMKCLCRITSLCCNPVKSGIQSWIDVKLVQWTEIELIENDSPATCSYECASFGKWSGRWVCSDQHHVTQRAPQIISTAACRNVLMSIFICSSRWFFVSSDVYSLMICVAFKVFSDASSWKNINLA